MGGTPTPSVFSQGCSLLPSVYADARYIDAVVVSKADFQVSVIQRLSAKLKELRLRNLFGAMIDADAQAVQSEISRMLSDGSIVTPGDALKLLTEGDNGKEFKATAVTMATTMIANAESRALESRL